MAALQQLEVLYVDCCTGLTDAGVAQLGRLCGLQQLHMAGCRQVRGTTLAQAAAAWPRLHKLELQDCTSLQEQGLAAAAGHLRALQHLDLTRCMAAVGQRACSALGAAQLSKLTHLCLRGCERVTSR
jgi:hypothetical protein